MVSSLSFLPEFTTDTVDAETAPRVMVGAASPLWLMFGGAAAAGATWWWWASRWRQALNTDAFRALAPEPLAPPAADWVEPTVDPVIATVPLADVSPEIVVQPLESLAEPPAETLAGIEASSHVMADAWVEVAAAPQPETLLPDTPLPEMLETTADPDAAETLPIEQAMPVADDLTRVVGIGPKLAASLSELGVTRFDQIAAWTPDDVKSIDQVLSLKGRADRDAWIVQARRLSSTEA